MKTIKGLVRVFTDELRYIENHVSYEKWASLLLKILFNGYDVNVFGGVLVPQLGDKVGVKETFDYSDNNFGLEIDEIHRVFEEQGIGDEVDFVTKKIRFRNDLYLWFTLSPIKNGFNSPIGYFWALVADKHKDEAQNVLDFASVLCARVVKSEKAFHALECLSQPSWSVCESVEGAMKYAVDLSIKALSCKAGVIWSINKNTRQLDTVYTAGEGCERLKLTMAIGSGLAGRCASEAKILMSDDLWKEKEISHQKVVRDKELHAAIFVPLDTGSEIVGVIGVYSSLIKGFSEIDTQIVIAISQILTSRLLQQSRIEITSIIKKKIDREMPLIEAGIKAMSEVHDIKNQLFFAQNHVSYVESWLKERYSENDPIIDKMQKIGKYVDEVGSVISGLVNRTKLIRVNFKKCNLSELIKKTIDKSSGEIKKERVSVKINVPEEEVYVNIDYEQIERVLKNLIENSLYFLGAMPRKREIEISLIVGDYITLVYRDNGPGIAPCDTISVFDVFFTTKGDRGMGFGLSIVKDIIEAHKGSISVQSVWGDFTEFKIKIPR